MLGFFKIITQKLLKVNLNTHKKKTLEKFQRSHLYYSKKITERVINRRQFLLLFQLYPLLTEISQTLLVVDIVMFAIDRTFQLFLY